LDQFPDGWRGATPDVAGEIFAAAKPARPRVATRLSVDLQAGARKAGGSGVAVRITDLSTHGFCMDTHLLFDIGSDVWLRLPSLELRHAKVAWVRGSLVGCAFEAPLSPFVVDLIVERARAG
jgi:hypothetical protein